MLANEPRYEREVLAAALRALRPEAELVELTGDRLEGKVAALQPRLVICSDATAAVRAHAPAWVLLYPDGADHAVVYLDGEETVVPTFGLDALVAAVDATVRRAPPAGADVM